jgi:hypothetical protein
VHLHCVAKAKEAHLGTPASLEPAQKSASCAQAAKQAARRKKAAEHNMKQRAEACCVLQPSVASQDNSHAQAKPRSAHPVQLCASTSTDSKHLTNNQQHPTAFKPQMPHAYFQADTEVHAHVKCCILP